MSCRIVSLGLILIAIVLSGPVAQADITVERGDEVVKISNGLWTVRMEKARGWTITRLRDGETGTALNGPLFVTHVRAKAHIIRNHGMQPGEAFSELSAKDIVLKIAGEGTDRVTVTRTWEHELGKASEQTVFHADARRFDRTFTFDAARPLGEIYVDARATDLWMANRAIFQPENERFVTASPTGYHTAGLPFVEAVDPQTGIGFGIKTSPTTPIQARYAYGDQDCGDDQYPVVRTRRFAGVSVFTPLLSYEDVPATYKIEYAGYMTTGGERPIEVDSPPIQIVKVWPKKLVVRPGEVNPVRVTLRNNTDAPRSAQLVVKLNHDLDKADSLLDTAITLQPGADQHVEVGAATNQIHYGVEAQAELVDTATGQKQTKSEYFSVHERTYRVSPALEIMSAGGARGRLAHGVPRLRAAYVGVTEMYCWAPNCTFDLTPDTNWYVPHTESQGSYLVAWSRDYVKEFVDACHDQGMSVVVELQRHMPLDYAMAHPQYAEYKPDGQFNGMPYYRIYKDASRLTQGVLPDDYEITLVGANFTDRKLGLAKMWGRELAASCRMFGWDGLRMDGSPRSFAGGLIPNMDPLKVNLLDQELPEPRRNFDGEPLVGSMDEADEIAYANLKEWHEEILKANPNFELGWNGGGALRDYINAGLYPKTMKYAGDFKSFMLHEAGLQIGRPEINTWDKWADDLMWYDRDARKLGQFMGVGHLRWLPAIGQRTRAYIAFACGYRLAYGGSDPHSYGSGELNKAFQFAWRFGKFIYDGAYELLPPEQQQVTVTGHERLMWKQFVRKRTLPGGVTEWLVHLVNLPEQDVILRHHNPPPVREGTVVHFPLPDGQQVIGAWALLPEPPRSVPCQADTADGQATVNLPPINAFTTAVLRTKSIN